MVQRFNLYLIIMLVLLITGCSTAANTAISSMPSTIVPVTQLPVSPTPIATDLPTTIHSPTLYPGEVEYHCIKVSNNVKQLGNVSGTLVLNGYLVPGTKGNPSLLFDIHSGNQISFVIDDLTNRIVVSPGGGYLAYDVWEIDSNKWQIKILDSTGNTLAKAVEQDLIAIEWLSDKTLLANSQMEHNPLVFLSPFDHKEKIMQPFVTEAERIAPFDHESISAWGFYALHKIIYNPILTRAIYAASDQKGLKIVFRDLISNQDISALHTQAWGTSPKWSPDGTKLAIGINTNYPESANLTEKDELAILDENGKQLFQTHLSLLPGSVYISSLSWSPDGSRVAFWYTTNEDVNRDLRLAVFDTRTQKTTDYCITNNGVTHSWHRNDTSPIWSPDGSFLLVETPNNTDKNNPNVVIVDLFQESATVIKTGYEPVGWMK